VVSSVVWLLMEKCVNTTWLRKWKFSNVFAIVLSMTTTNWDFGLAHLGAELMSVRDLATNHILSISARMGVSTDTARHAAKCSITDESRARKTLVSIRLNVSTSEPREGVFQVVVDMMHMALRLLSREAMAGGKRTR
jgi:hypothetical protein